MIKHWCGEWFMKTYPLRCCKCWASVTKPVAGWDGRSVRACDLAAITARSGSVGMSRRSCSWLVWLSVADKQTDRRTGGCGNRLVFHWGAATFAKKVGCQIRFKLVVVMMDHFSRACQEVTWYKFLSHKLMRGRIERQTYIQYVIYTTNPDDWS